MFFFFPFFSQKQLLNASCTRPLNKQQTMPLLSRRRSVAARSSPATKPLLPLRHLPACSSAAVSRIPPHVQPSANCHLQPPPAPLRAGGHRTCRWRASLRTAAAPGRASNQQRALGLPWGIAAPAAAPVQPPTPAGKRPVPGTTGRKRGDSRPADTTHGEEEDLGGGEGARLGRCCRSGSGEGEAALLGPCG